MVCQNKFVKLVHLVGFYYKEICYDAPSPERGGETPEHSFKQTVPKSIH